MAQPKNLDLLGIMVLAVLVLILSIFPVEITWLRALLALPLALYGIGYAGGAILFQPGRLGGAERFMLSLGLSLCGLILSGLLLNWLPGGLSRENWAGMILLISAICTILAYTTRRSLNIPAQHRILVSLKELLLPVDGKNFSLYSGSWLVRTVGHRLAGRIITEMGAEITEILDHHPKRLLKVHGVGPVRMKRIMQAWQKQKELIELRSFLVSNAIDTRLAGELQQRYGSQALFIIQSEPYRLVEEYHGFSIASADRIASSQYLLHNDPSHRKTLFSNLVRWLRQAPVEAKKRTVTPGANRGEQIPYHRRLKARIPQVVLFGLAAVVMTFSVGLSLLPAPLAPYQGYSMFWLAPVNSNPSGEAELGLRSMEFSLQSYRIEVYNGEKLLYRWDDISLSPKQEWVSRLSLGDNFSGNELLQARLYRLDQPNKLYREVRLWKPLN